MKAVYRLAVTFAILAAGCHPADTSPVLWAEQATDRSLTDVQQLAFAGSQAGWAVGGYYAPNSFGTHSVNYLLRTTNGGSTWTSIDLTPLNTAIGFRRGFSPVTDQLVYGVADDLPLSLVRGARSRFVYKSQDGGQTWQRLPSVGYFDGPVTFPTAQVGLSAYSSTISRTADGGNTWQAVWSGGQQWVSQTQFLNATTGYAAGNCLLKSTDQGQTWQPLPWTHGLMTQVAFLSESVGFAVTSSGIICDPGPCPGGTGPTSAVYRTQDGGQTWQQLLAPADGSFAFVSAQEFYRAGSGIEHTRDGGQTWQTEYTLAGAAGNTSPDFFASICFPAPNTGYALSHNGLIVKRLPTP